MKFMLFLLLRIPATLADRKKLRPNAYHLDRWQAMFQEVVELAQCAEELGFNAVAFPEHHLQSEGGQMGAPYQTYSSRPYWLRFAWLGSAPLGCHNGVVGSTNARTLICRLCPGLSAALAESNGAESAYLRNRK